MIHLLVMGPNELERACMVAGLADAGEVLAEACADPADHSGPAPDMLLLRDADDPSGSTRLADRLRELRVRWPTTKVIVLTGGAEAGMALCQTAGVRACLPAQAGPDAIAAVIRLARMGLIIYPEQLLNAVGRYPTSLDPIALNGAIRPDRAR